jgi:hypothetical protein
LSIPAQLHPLLKESPLSRSFSTAIKAARQLGISSLYHYACYQAGLSCGYYRWKSNQPDPVRPGSLRPVLNFPARQTLLETLGEAAGILIQQAKEIVQGRIRLFGSHLAPLELAPPPELAHWTAYERGKQSFDVQDVKTIWEPARLGWAFTLGRAYLLTGDESYAQSFWKHAETFLDANPAYLGPNWFSGQEVALRILAFVFAFQVFSHSNHSTGKRKERLSEAVAQHATRIPLTLVYAKAQNNNHLLTEAAGLYTAGLSLPEHPASERWRYLGWRIFNQALQTQISAEGTYIQHSANYHRLMLQTLLWVNSLTIDGNTLQPLPGRSRKQGVAAVDWLMALIDPDSGRVPNLGPNDGAYILPLTTCPFNDYRPVLQTAASTFLGVRPFPPGPLDEMALWLGREATSGKGREFTLGPQAPVLGEPHVLKNDELGSWAYLRAARYSSRPGHADQLHFDLWWRGINVALDPGTYQYNAKPPWDNSLARTEVHNTVCINGKDQMKRAGRFLWLDWAQAQILEHQRAEDGSLISLTAQHDGYRHDGVIHQRGACIQEHGWQVQDELLPVRNTEHGEIILARLHWLLPDLPWKLLEDGVEHQSTIQYRLGIKSDHGWIQLKIGVSLENPSQEAEIYSRIQLVRAGELLHGSGEISPTWGWFSPTYNQKIPALSVSVMVNARLPLRLTSDWIFPTAPSYAKL